MLLFTNKFIVAGSCMLVVVSCSQASVQLTSLSSSLRSGSSLGSVVLHETTENNNNKDIRIIIFILIIVL